MKMEQLIKNLDHATVLPLAEQVTYEAGKVVLEGEAEITIDGTPHTVTGGNAIVMPAGIPHAVKAIKPFKMLLTVVKQG